MKYLNSIVKNPLTIIAIFASVAEVSGSAVLVNLPESIQAKFVWFVMMFPVLLVVLFFIVLLWKHHVLYAPSDFQDEEAFTRLAIKPQTKEDRKQSKKDDFDKFIEVKDGEIQVEGHVPTILIEPAKLNYYLAEEYAFRKLQKPDEPVINREVQLELAGRTFLVDGLVERGPVLFIYETKTINNADSLESILDSTYKHFSDISESYDKTSKTELELIFVLVLISVISKTEMTKASERIKSYVKERRPFINHEILYYDELIDEFGID